MSKGRGRSGGKQRVRTAKRRSASSTAWLQRQLNDPYVKKAKAEGYRSRAAYKLIEIIGFVHDVTIRKGREQRAVMVAEVHDAIASVSNNSLLPYRPFLLKKQKTIK